MAFRFNWSGFDNAFYNEAKQMLTNALNKGKLPAKIAGPIEVSELNMGTKAPELEILEIGELSEDKCRGIFKLVYDGNAYVVLKTKIQANPMSQRSAENGLSARLRILAANQPLVVPMQLRISQLRLRGIIVLVVSKQHGVTLVFKNDPLEHVEVNSTFDELPSIQRLLQREITQQLRTLFQDDLPNMVHTLSQHWINSNLTPEEDEMKGDSDVRCKSKLDDDMGLMMEWTEGVDESDWPVVDDDDDSSLKSGCCSPARSIRNRLRIPTDGDKDNGFKDLAYLSDGSDETLDGYMGPRIVHARQSYDCIESKRYVHRRVASTCTLMSLGPRSPSVDSCSPFSDSASEHYGLHMSRKSCPTPLNLNQPSRLLTCQYPSPAKIISRNLNSTPTLDTSSLDDEMPWSGEKIVLNSSDSPVASQLVIMMHSNHTISPYTRPILHTAFRSLPQTTNSNRLNQLRRPNGKKMRRKVVQLPMLSNPFPASVA